MSWSDLVPPHLRRAVRDVVAFAIGALLMAFATAIYVVVKFWGS